jgi:DNA-binding response OmpR family regulator
VHMAQPSLIGQGWWSLTTWPSSMPRSRLPQRLRSTERSLPTRRALIVEDEFWIAMGLEAEMHALGFDVCDLATNGYQASIRAMEDQPDIVLMDINLEGGREGIEVARRLRRVCGAPIVFVTGYSERDTLERILEQVPGAPVLPKPVLFDHLADAVAEVIHPHH